MNKTKEQMKNESNTLVPQHELLHWASWVHYPTCAKPREDTPHQGWLVSFHLVKGTEHIYPWFKSHSAAHELCGFRRAVGPLCPRMRVQSSSSCLQGALWGLHSLHLCRGFGGRSHCPTGKLTSVDHLNLPLALVPWLGYLLALGQDLSTASPEGWVFWPVREGRQESWCHHPSEESIRATKRQRHWPKAEGRPHTQPPRTEQNSRRKLASLPADREVFFFKDSPHPYPRPQPLAGKHACTALSIFPHFINSVLV